MELFFDVNEVINWLRQFGIWAILVSLLINIGISILGVVPSLFLSGANAVVFGMVPGFFISILGEVLGAGLSFFLYRWGIHKVNAMHSEKWRWVHRINDASRGRRIVLLFIARVTPLIPSGVITFAAAASNMVFVDFIIVTFLGKAPSIVMETLIGHDLLLLNDNFPRLLISLLLITVILIFFRKKHIKKEEYENGKK
ncbi:TVP38/TMEM64 family protein [Paenibacillus agricola]|uniref:TVP38/TMEM64 family membrane protein n=1 Tax=Paenibacillus agricola TaxID=2716264 RepID=A0ABX0JAY9_9BACL|nr:VTT domain-containing protein [Paenibacillus agricola]NHN33302.1 TVP38/TMEM64 family protein [Paenibacillus agricola]